MIRRLPVYSMIYSDIDAHAYLHIYTCMYSVFIHTLVSETMDAGSWQSEDLYTGIPGPPKNVMRSAC